jgi:ribose 5-phosphate isomerase A
MYQEKLLMHSSPKNYILVDQSKLVTELGEKFPIPVEIFPDAIHLIEEALGSF